MRTQLTGLCWWKGWMILTQWQSGNAWRSAPRMVRVKWKLWVYSVPFLQSAPEKSVFTNHLLRLCGWAWKILYSSKQKSVLDSGRARLQRCNVLWTLVLACCCGKQNTQFSVFMHIRCWKRTCWCAWNCTWNCAQNCAQNCARNQARYISLFLTTPICSCKHVWNSLTVSNRNYANTAIGSMKTP